MARRLLATLLVLGTTAACELPPEGSTRELIEHTIRFRAEIAGEPFVCGRGYGRVGLGAGDIEVLDLRLYVSAVRLVRDDGVEVPLQLAEDGRWQREGVALLDFEDGSGPCAEGTAAIHTEVSGRAPAGHYVGLRFDLGVPFELNHRDVSTIGAPLDLRSGMYWSWRTGYTFLQASVRSAGQPAWLVHLGSTGCVETAPNQVATCSHPNRADVHLDLDPEHDTVVADLADLLAHVNLDVNAGLEPGCMGAREDPDCAPVLRALGLPMDGEPTTPQRLFHAGPR